MKNDCNKNDDHFDYNFCNWFTWYGNKWSNSFKSVDGGEEDNQFDSWFGVFFLQKSIKSNRNCRRISLRVWAWMEEKRRLVSTHTIECNRMSNLHLYWERNEGLKLYLFLLLLEITFLVTRNQSNFAFNQKWKRLITIGTRNIGCVCAFQEYLLKAIVLPKCSMSLDDIDLCFDSCVRMTPIDAHWSNLTDNRQVNTFELLLFLYNDMMAAHYVSRVLKSNSCTLLTK